MNQKTILFVIVSTAILALLIVSGIYLRTNNELKSEKLNSKDIMSRKTVVETELQKAKSIASSLQEKIEANIKMLNESSAMLGEADRKLSALAVENSRLRSDKKEFAALKEQKTALESELSKVNSDYEKLLAESRDLRIAISSLEDEKSMLEQNLKMASLLKTDNFLVTATRGKKSEKLVVKASRTKKLNVNFEIPQSLTGTLSFSIITPAGAEIKPEDKNLTWHYSDDQRNLTASLSGASGEFEESRKVVMNYTPAEKLAKGEYRIQIQSNGTNIGNCRMVIR